VKGIEQLHIAFQPTPRFALVDFTALWLNLGKEKGR
jgi:hypothetical protein